MVVLCLDEWVQHMHMLIAPGFILSYELVLRVFLLHEFVIVDYLRSLRLLYLLLLRVLLRSGKV